MKLIEKCIEQIVIEAVNISWFTTALPVSQQEPV